MLPVYVPFALWAECWIHYIFQQQDNIVCQWTQPEMYSVQIGPISNPKWHLECTQRRPWIDSTSLPQKKTAESKKMNQNEHQQSSHAVDIFAHLMPANFNPPLFYYLKSVCKLMTAEKYFKVQFTWQPF